MIKRPFIVLLCALCLGILCRKQGTLVALLAVVVYILFLFFNRLKRRYFSMLLKGSFLVILAPFCLVLGAGLGSFADRDYDIDLCLAQTKAGKADGTVSGRVTEVIASASGFKVTLSDIFVTAEGGEFTEGKALVFIAEANVKIGETVLVKGTVREFMRSENPGQFDERAYYRAKGYSFKVQASSCVVTGGKARILKEALRRFRERLAGVYDLLFPEDVAGVIKALILGDKSTLPEDTNELFKRNGIAHILAISGLHVSMVGTALFMLLRALKSPMIPATAVTSVVLLLYGLMTGFSVSTIRAVFMLIFSLVAKCLGRASDPGESCAIIGIPIVLACPLIVYQASFVLSFAAAIGIGYFSREFAKWERLEEKNTAAALLKTVVSTMAPQVSTIPLIWMYYYEIPVYSLLVNLLVLPGMALLVALATVAGIVGLAFIKLALFPAGGAFFLVKAYEFICDLTLKLPGPLLLYGNPGRLRMLICYAFVLAFFVTASVLGKKKPKKRHFSALVLLLVPLVFIRLPSNSVNMDFLSVGQGDCCVIRVSGKKAVIVDCGSTSASLIAKYRLVPYLKYNGIDTVEAVFITHPDKDHTSGILELLSDIDNSVRYTGTVRVKRLVVTPETLKSEKMAEIFALCEEKGVEVLTFLAGDVFLAGELSMTCLYPAKAQDTADNAGSLVFLASAGSYDALLLGDSGTLAERAVLAAAASGLFELPVDLLKVAHHGSKNSSSEAFIRAVSPTVAILSYGRGNFYNHPNPIVVERLEAVNALIYKTGAGGAACFKIR